MNINDIAIAEKDFYQRLLAFSLCCPFVCLSERIEEYGTGYRQSIEVVDFEKSNDTRDKCYRVRFVVYDNKTSADKKMFNMYMFKNNEKDIGPYLIYSTTTKSNKSKVLAFASSKEYMAFCLQENVVSEQEVFKIVKRQAEKLNLFYLKRCINIFEKAFM